MKRVIAAVDESLATAPVLATASALAVALSASVEALHVSGGSADVVRWQCDHAGVPLRVVLGETVERLAAAAREPDVVTLVLGARGRPSGRPLGATAFDVSTSVDAPVVIVPPDVTPQRASLRILVPLSGTLASARAPRRLVDFAQPDKVEVVVLHVHDVASLPLFTDQPQHDARAWATEFLARYCPSDPARVRFIERVGSPEEEVPAVAEEVAADLVALGWGRVLEAGRAPVVRALLDRGRVPVALIPVEARDGAEVVPGWTASLSSRA